MADELVGVVGGDPSKAAEQRAASDAQVDKDMDDALAKIIGPGDEPAPPQEAADTPKDGRARDDTGRFKSKDKTDDVVAEASSEPEETSQPAKPEVVNSEEYRKALQALQLDKVPASVLDTMDPTELIEWGTARAQNHADVDRMIHRAPSEKDATSANKPESSDDLDWKEMVEPFSEYFGEDAAGPLRAFGEKLLAKAGGGNSEQVAKLTAMVQRQGQELARTALTEKWNLSDQGRWNQVLEHRAKDANEYASESDAVEAAARQVFADETISDYQARLAKQHKARSIGQPETQSRRQPVGDTKPTMDVEDDLLNAITSGDNEGVQRARGELRRRGSKSLSELSVAGRVGVK